MNKSVSSTTFQRLLISLVICAILPFLLNSLFANPWTDDFTYTTMSRDIGFIQAQIFWFEQWTGRYFSTALLSLNPLVYGHMWGYKMIPMAIIVSFSVVIFCMISDLTKHSLSFWEKLLFSLLLLFVYLDQMPDVRPGLYWMSGSITYQVGAILMLAFFSIILRIKRDSGHKTIYCILAVILALALPGTNEIVIATLLPLFSLFVALEYRRNKKVAAYLIAILIAMGAGTCCALFAPGNMVRLASYGQDRSMIIALEKSVEATFSTAAVWIGAPTVLILTLLVMMATTRDAALKDVFRYSHPGISTTMCLLLPLACFFTTYWSTGFYPDRRVLNFIYLLFLMGWLLNAAIIAAKLASYASTCTKIFNSKVILPPLVIYLVLLLCWGHSNFLLVTTDLIDGTSYRYNRELQQRYAKIIEDKSPDCKVETLRYTPKSHFFDDIYYSSDGWINRSYARYFGKKSIVLGKIKSSPPSF